MTKLIKVFAIGTLGFILCATGCTKKKIVTSTTYETSIETGITDYTRLCTGLKYYVSTSGNDSNDGLSIDKPFKTLAKANSIKLQPGDGIFFKRGDQWKGEQLDLYNSGSTEKKVYYSAYGEGDRPLIITGGKDQVCVSIRNSDNFVISSIAMGNSYGGLEISFNEQLYAKTAPNGKTYQNDEAMERHNVVVEDLYCFNMTGSATNSDEYQYNHTSFGLAIRNRYTGKTASYVLDGLQVRNCYFRNCNEGMNFICHIGQKFEGGNNTGLIKHALIENNTAELCGQWGMHFNKLYDSVLRNNVTRYTGQNANNFGSCAFLLVLCNNVLVDNLLIDEHYRNIAQSYDGCGFDFEGGNINCSLINSTIRNVDGCGVFIFDNSSNKDNIDILIDNVHFENCGINVQGAYSKSVYQVGLGHTGKISNCIFTNFKDLGDLTDFEDGDVPSYKKNDGIIFENNKEVQTTTGYNYKYEVDGNVKHFAKTYFGIKGEKDFEYYGSTVDSVNVKNGALVAEYGVDGQYLSGPDAISCKLSWAKEFVIKVKNNSTATKMIAKFSMSKGEDKQIEIPLPASGSEASEVKVDLTTAIEDRRGIANWFRLYLKDGLGQVSIYSISILGGNN